MSAREYSAHLECLKWPTGRPPIADVEFNLFKKRAHEMSSAELVGLMARVEELKARIQILLH